MKTKIIKIIITAVFGILLVANLIFNIKILKSNNNQDIDIYMLDYQLDSISSDVESIKKQVDEIEYDVDYIKLYMD